MTAPGRGVSGRLGHTRVLVVTILDEEFDAVRTQLPAPHEVSGSSVYAPAAPSNPADPFFPYLVAQTRDRSNTPVAQDIARWAMQYQPEVFIVCGIAGAIQRERATSASGSPAYSGLVTGDVAVANYIHYGNYAKYVDGQRLQRYFPLDHPAVDLVAHCEAVKRDPALWLPTIAVQRPAEGSPTVEVGEFVALEAVASDPSHQAQREYVQHFDNAIAIDMESMGVGRALHDLRATVHYNPRWACIRGISDGVRAIGGDSVAAPDSSAAAELTNNEERKKWKTYAAAAAAAYTRQVVARLLLQPREGRDADPAVASWTLP